MKNKTVRSQKSGAGSRNGAVSLPDRSLAGKAEGGMKREETPRGPGVAMMIKRSLVDLDPGQPRKSINEEKLNELVDSIRARGIIQRLVVEELPPTAVLHAPDLVSDDWHLRAPSGEHLYQHASEAVVRDFVKREGYRLETRYQVICGERRHRAAEILELAELPCDVHRDVTSEERRDWQLIENLQRENVTALEEAEAMVRTLEERQAADPAYKPEHLYKSLGLSRANYYNRVNLTRAHTVTREALLAGKLNATMAVEVCMLPLPDDQARMVKLILKQAETDNPYSSRQVEELREQFMRQLSGAPFKADRIYAAGEEEDAGLMFADTCTICPHRTGNMLEQFPALATRPSVCTQPKCFAAKCRAHFRAEAEEFKAKGHAVMSFQEMEDSPVQYVAGKSWEHQAENRNGTVKDMMGKFAPKAVIVVDEDGNHEFYAEADYKAACVKNKVKFYEAKPAAAGQTPEEKAKAEEKRKAEAEKIARRLAFPLTKLPELLGGIAKIKDAAAWDLFQENSENFDPYDMDEDYEKVLVGRAKTSKAKILGRLFASNQMGPVAHTGEWDKEVLKAWALAGVDLAEEFKGLEKAAQTVLPLPVKKETKQKELPLLAAFKKAKIAAAAKTRWAKVKAAK